MFCIGYFFSVFVIMSKEILIYDLNLGSLQADSEKPLGKLLEKVIEKGNRVLFLCNDEEELDYFDKALWTYEQLSFLMHGSKKTQSIKSIIKEIPIYLSFDMDDIALNPNGANILLIASDKLALDDYHKLPGEIYEKYDKVIFFLRNGASLNDKLASNDNVNDKNLSIIYWQRDNEGRWRRG